MSVFMALLVGLVLELILACLVDRPPPGDERATDPVSSREVYCMLMLKIYMSMCPYPLKSTLNGDGNFDLIIRLALSAA